jgi:hypothetical protein
VIWPPLILPERPPPDPAEFLTQFERIDWHPFPVFHHIEICHPTLLFLFFAEFGFKRHMTFFSELLITRSYARIHQTLGVSLLIYPNSGHTFYLNFAKADDYYLI